MNAGTYGEANKVMNEIPTAGRFWIQTGDLEYMSTPMNPSLIFCEKLVEI